MPPAPKRPRVTIKKTVESYLADTVSRNVAEATLDKLTTIFEKQFLPWTQAQGLEYIDEIDLDILLNFRSTWKDGALAKQKKQSRVIGFFWACVRCRFLIENPALGLGRIKVIHIPTDYFPPDEFQRTLDATYVYGDPRGGYIPIEDMRTRLRTLTLLMRWSGLRIRYAILLERHRLQGDSLPLYQATTGTPVYVPLPSYLVKALETLPLGPKPNARYFFWSGNGKPKSAVADWQRLSPPLRTGRYSQAGRRAQAVPPSHVPRHLRSRDAACGRSHRSGVPAPWTCIREDHGKELRAVREVEADSAAGERQKCVERTSAYRRRTR